MPVKLLEGAIIDDYRVSRQEEAESLAYIKRSVVRQAVEDFEVNKLSHGRMRSDIVDPAHVARSLRKVEHHHAGEPGNPVDEADYIVYEGYDSTEDAWPPTNFEFFITKDHDEHGWIFLVAGYKDPLKIDNRITSIVVRRTKQYPPKKINEGNQRQPQPGETIPLLSKREKDEAFYKLKLIVLPKAVNELNNYLIGRMGKNAPQMTVQDALKHLKKMSDHGNKVVYKAEIPGIGAVVLFTEKKNNRFFLNPFDRVVVYIGYMGAGGTDAGGGRFPHQFIMNSGKPSLEESYEHLPFSQRPDEPPKPITRKEEAFVLNAIKKHYIGEFPDIGKHIRRIRDWPSSHPELRSDSVRYEYNNGHDIVVFDIMRTQAGIWIRTFTNRDNLARDNFHVNILNQTLTEAFEDPQKNSQYLTRRDIHEAIDFIKKKIIPIVIREYDKKKIRHDDKITPEELAKNLRITTMRGITVFLQSIIKGRDFNFRIAKGRHMDKIQPNSKVLKNSWKLAAGYVLPLLMDKETDGTTWFWVGYPDEPSF